MSGIDLIASIPVLDVYKDFDKKGVVMPDERLETTPFGMRQFSVLDLDGNRITFAEPAAS